MRAGVRRFILVHKPSSSPRSESPSTDGLAFDFARTEAVAAARRPSRRRAMASMYSSEVIVPSAHFERHRAIFDCSSELYTLHLRGFLGEVFGYGEGD